MHTEGDTKFERSESDSESYSPTASSLLLARSYAACLFSAYGLILLLHHSFPSLADFSNWTYEGRLLRNHLLGLPNPWHTLKHYPVPNSLTSVSIGLLGLVFSWQMAGKLWLCALFVLAFVSIRHMMRTCRGGAALWLIAPAIFLSTNLWYGNLNFQFGLGWLILVASYLLREERREWILGVLMTAVFFTHMIPFAFAGLLVVLYAVQTRRIKLLWQLAPGALLSAWYVWGRFAVAGDADGKGVIPGAVRTYSAAFWAYKANSFLKSFGFINPVDAHGSIALRVVGSPAFVCLLLTNAALCMVVGWYLARGAVRGLRERRPDRFIWQASFLFFVMFLLAPAEALGVSDPGSRLLQSVLAITVFLCLSASGVSLPALRAAAASAVLLQTAAVLLFVRAGFSSELKGATTTSLPWRLVMFAHVPIRIEDGYLQALDRNDMRLGIFPTAMFLNTPAATRLPAAPETMPWRR